MGSNILGDLFTTKSKGKQTDRTFNQNLFQLK